MFNDMFHDTWRRVSAHAKRRAQFYRAGLNRSAPHSVVEAIRSKAESLGKLDDPALQAFDPASRVDAIAKAVVACERVLHLRPHDVQILGAVAMIEGRIAEMQTGEGKTLAAVLAVAEIARVHEHVHVLTANDYLAERDAHWMGPLYKYLGLSVGFLTQSMTPEQRREAYACRVTYATPNEIGFDFLRDNLALLPDQLVLPEFDAVLIDEADSILIDEARIPLVIAGGQDQAEVLARQMAELAAEMSPGYHYTIDQAARNVSLTDAGIARAERATGLENLYATEALGAHSALQAALHARALLRRDIDYLVTNDAIELVDVFKGRIAENRRWPAQLQTALEAKEGLPLRKQGRVLGSITLQNLIRMYPFRSGMTGTAVTEAQEFREFYKMDVVPIPTDRPLIRRDLPDAVFRNQRDKQAAVIEAIAKIHASGRPVLVGTASVAESEQMSAMLVAYGILHEVLNARHDLLGEEARVIAQAGQRDAVTISTNRAGRGTDIVLGEGVAELGGLHVIGTHRHESRRIDHQLRGRAGRQGDPGSSRFYVALDDEMLVRHGIGDWTPDVAGIETVQRTIEGEYFQLRKVLWKYDGLIEHQRQMVQDRRRAIFEGQAPVDTRRRNLRQDVERRGAAINTGKLVPLDEAERRSLLLSIDDLWSEYLAIIQELRDGIAWRSWAGREPFLEFVHESDRIFTNLLDQMEELESSDDPLPDRERGATWTYVISDQPFGDLWERQVRGMRKSWVHRKAVRHG
ncbi:MAG: DEAD/DEAH box helicase [Acidobacteriota bacterium]